MEKTKHICVVKCCGTNSQRMLNVPTKICKNNCINKGDYFHVTTDGQNRIVYEKLVIRMRKEGKSSSIDTSPNCPYMVISPSSGPNKEDQEAVND